MNPQKIGGVIILFFGPMLGVLARDGHLFFVASGLALMMIFFAKERVEDERVLQLKMKALFVAMNAGIAATWVGAYYLNLPLATLLSIPPRSPGQALTAFEFITGSSSSPSASFITGVGKTDASRRRNEGPVRLLGQRSGETSGVVRIKRRV